LEFTISLPKATFYMGETIPVHLEVAAGPESPYVSDNPGQSRANSTETYILDRPEAVEDPLHGARGFRGGPGSTTRLRDRKFAWDLDMNEWIRFLQPGTYHLYVRTDRVHVAEPPDPALLGFTRLTTLEAVSNVVVFEVLPAPPEWIKQRIAAAVQVLDHPPTNDSVGRKKWQDAARTLEYLDSMDANMALLNALNGDGSSDGVAMHERLLASPQRAEFLPAMERQLIAADGAIYPRHLTTLSQLAVIDEIGGRVNISVEENQRRESLERARRATYIGRLLAALPTKQPPARATSLQTLMLEARGAPAPPVWAPLIADEVISAFRDLPTDFQYAVLSSQWDLLKKPAMISVLRDVYANAPAQRVRNLKDLALRRLIELAPAQGRALLLPQLTHANQLMWETVSSLPDDSLPELDEALMEAWYQLGDNVIARYLSGAMVERVKRRYDTRGQASCPDGLLTYFLRYDPAYGEELIRRRIANCGALGLPHEMHPAMMSPALERVAIDHLMASTLQVKRDSAEVLGKYGSAATFQPLWSTMKTFYSWWKGRGEELDRNTESREQETALAKALIQSKAWKLTPAQLNELAEMCTSTDCKRIVAAELKVR
jgi:hypothetical protein